MGHHHHHCSEGECHTHSHSHGKDGHCHDDSCCSSSCGKHEEEHEHCDFSQQLLELADEAWMCVLKEKIKKQIESTCSAQLDELAKLVSETNKQRWKQKMCADHSCAEFEDKVKEILSSHKCST